MMDSGKTYAFRQYLRPMRPQWRTFVAAFVVVVLIFYGASHSSHASDKFNELFKQQQQQQPQSCSAERIVATVTETLIQQSHSTEAPATETATKEVPAKEPPATDSAKTAPADGEERVKTAAELLAIPIPEWNFSSPEFPVLQQGAKLHAQSQVDTFAPFKKDTECSFSTSQLHHEFEPKCQDRKSLLRAMSGGGRHGFDQPYSALGCDFRWFNTEEICDIASRFQRVYIVGDSLTRQLVLALHILLREDLVDGARQVWRQDAKEGDAECHCRGFFSKRAPCFWWETVETDAIKKNDPSSIKCKKDIASFQLFWMTVYPLKYDDLQASVKHVMEKHNEGDRTAFIMMHGAWADYKPEKSKGWLEQIEAHWRSGLDFFTAAPKLFISPASNGENKHPWVIDKGNNIHVQLFTHEIEHHVTQKGYDHMGLFNLTVQATSFDGTHMSLESALTGAMMIFNWLSALG